MRILTSRKNLPYVHYMDAFSGNIVDSKEMPVQHDENLVRGPGQSCMWIRIENRTKKSKWNRAFTVCFMLTDGRSTVGRLSVDCRSSVVYPVVFDRQSVDQ